MNAGDSTRVAIPAPCGAGVTRLLVRVPLGRRLRAKLRKTWPLLLWCGAALAAVVLHPRSGFERPVPATVERRVVVVASPSAGSVLDVPVQPGDAVIAGQVVASLDPAQVRLDGEILLADLARLEAEMGASRQDWEIARNADRMRRQEALVGTTRLELERTRQDEERLRQRIGQSTTAAELAAERESIEIELLKTRALIEVDRVEVEGLVGQILREERLVAASAAAGTTLESLRVRRAALEKRIQCNAEVASGLEDHRERHRARFSVWEALVRPEPIESVSPLPGRLSLAALDAAPAANEPDLEIYLAPVRASIEVQKKRLEEIQARIEGLVLRSPASGRIGEVFLVPGAFAGAGSPILTVIQSRPGHFTAHVPEGRHLELAPGDRVRLTPRSRRGEPLEGRVSEVASDLVEAPRRFTTRFDAPFWAREATIVAEEAPDLVPGEAYDVSRID